MYNEFICELQCPNCRERVIVSAQGYIGRLDHSRFSPGDLIVSPDSPKVGGVVGPFPEVLKENSSFWAYALDNCCNCDGDIWVKVFVDNHVYVRAGITETPQNPEDWSRY